jgi:hypothetical protein
MRMKMNKKKIPVIFPLIFLAYILSACGSSDSSASTGDAAVSGIYTSVVKTLTAQATPIQDTPTPFVEKTVAADASSTPEDKKPELPAASSNPAQAEPAATATTGCDNAIYVSDVSIPDGTVLAPGEFFSKTWKLQNTGVCKWTTSYELAFVSGNALSGSTTGLEDSVSPNAKVNISVSMVAPKTTGTYTGYWKLKNASSAWFGESVYVKIEVSDDAETITPTPTATDEGDEEEVTSTSTETPEVTATRTKTYTKTPTLEEDATETPVPEEST